MIRPTLPEDVETLIQIAAETEVFKPKELVTLEEVFEDYVDEPGGEGYHCYTFEENGEPLGFASYGPNTMTDGTWDLYWIAVRKDQHGKGIGTQLLHFVENDIKEQRGRLIIIDTASLPSYEPTRRFYLKHGYEQVATVLDYYGDGDSLVIFRKRVR